MKYCLKCGSELSDYATTCGVCGTSVSQEAQPETSAYPPTEQTQNFAPSYTPVAPTENYSYDPTYDLQPKKSKKGLLFGLIGGGVGIVAIILILCLCFCGGSVEFGMTVNDTHDAMLSNDFIPGLADYDVYDDEKTASTRYKGEVGDLNTCVVSFEFNQKNRDELYQCYIETKADLNAAKEFVTDELDAACKEYDNPYDGDGASQYIYLCENGTRTAIIYTYKNVKYPELGYIRIEIGDTAYMPDDEKESWNNTIDRIKDN